MSDTKPTSIRIPEEIIAVADGIAKAKEWSRAKVLVRSIECGLPLVGDRTFKGYQQNHDQAEANLIKRVVNREPGAARGWRGEKWYRAKNSEKENVASSTEIKTDNPRGVAGEMVVRPLENTHRLEHAANCNCFTCKPPKDGK